jgi:hypothetical protein
LILFDFDPAFAMGWIPRRSSRLHSSQLTRIANRNLKPQKKKKTFQLPLVKLFPRISILGIEVLSLPDDRSALVGWHPDQLADVGDGGVCGFGWYV